MKPQCPEGRRLRREAGLWLHLVTDRPQEGSDLTGDRRRDHRGLRAFGDRPSVTGAVAPDPSRRWSVPRQPVRIVWADCRGQRRAVLGITLPPIRDGPRFAVPADRLLVASRSAFEQYAVLAHRIAAS